MNLLKLLIRRVNLRNARLADRLQSFRGTSVQRTEFTHIYLKEEYFKNVETLCKSSVHAAGAEGRKWPGHDRIHAACRSDFDHRDRRDYRHRHTRQHQVWNDF